MRLPACSQVQRLVVVVHDAAFDDDAADQILVAPQLVDQVLPPAAGTQTIIIMLEFQNFDHVKIIIIISMSSAFIKDKKKCN